MSEDDPSKDQRKPEAVVAVPIIPLELHDGRDELNFAEFPLGAVCDRLPTEQKTLIFEDRIFDAQRGELVTRKLTITGADAFGLPTASDDDVLLALIQLSKLQRFESRTVHFTRYQVVKLLGWPLNGPSYQRVEDALDRWLGVTLKYDNAWRGKNDDSWRDNGGKNGFHVLDNVKIDKSETEKTRPKPNLAQQNFEFASSSFSWNDDVYQSFLQGNLKALDFAFVMALKSAVSRRLYRFLDKRFWKLKVLEFDLLELAFEHIPLSRKTELFDVKRQIGKAVDELVTTGFLRDIPKEKRFRKIRAGKWVVRFEKNDRYHEPDERRVEIPTKTKESSAVQLLSQQLVSLGVSAQKAEELVRSYETSWITEKIEVFNALLAKKDKRISTNPPGFLIRSIEARFETPRNFEGASVREAKEQVKKEQQEEQKARVQRRQDREAAKEKARHDAIAGYWATLTNEEKQKAEAAALAKGDRFRADLVQKGGPAGKAALESLLDEYALDAIEQGSTKLPS